MHRLLQENFFHLRRHSLLRANLIVATSLLASFLISGFTPTIPLIRATPWQVLPLLTGLAGSVETARCIRPRWGFYHAAVVLFIYADLLVLTLIAFFLLFPYILQK